MKLHLITILIILFIILFSVLTINFPYIVLGTILAICFVSVVYIIIYDFVKSFFK